MRHANLLSERVRQLLRCPDCQGSLVLGEEALSCEACGGVFPILGDALDLRPRRPKDEAIHVDLGSAATPPALDRVDDRLEPNPAATFDYRAITLGRALSGGNRLTPELLSYLPQADSAAAQLLDLGCGPQGLRPIAEAAGYGYVGLDAEADAPIIGDAHALPFADDSFDAIVTLAVVEHLRYPRVGMREMRRVLKPSGVLIGTGAFIEPLHGSASYFHPTALGMLELLESSGLEPVRLAPNLGWGGLNALAKLSLFPGMPKPVSDLAVLPLLIAHRLWWTVRYRLAPSPFSSEHFRRVSFTGGFRFVARKRVEEPKAPPPDPEPPVA